MYLRYTFLDQVTLVNDDEIDAINDNIVNFAEIDEEVQLLFLILFLKFAQRFVGHYINKLKN